MTNIEIEQKLHKIISEIPRNGYKDNNQKNWVSLDENILYEKVKEIFNLGLEIAADHAEADYTVIGEVPKDPIEVYVLKGSILRYKL